MPQSDTHHLLRCRPIWSGILSACPLCSFQSRCVNRATRMSRGWAHNPSGMALHIEQAWAGWHRDTFACPQIHLSKQTQSHGYYHDHDINNTQCKDLCFFSLLNYLSTQAERYILSQGQFILKGFVLTENLHIYEIFGVYSPTTHTESNIPHAYISLTCSREQLKIPKVHGLGSSEVHAYMNFTLSNFSSWTAASWMRQMFTLESSRFQALWKHEWINLLKAT